MRLDTTNPADVIAYLKNGIQYHFDVTKSMAGLPTRIVDPNGNQIAISQIYGTGSQAGTSQITVTDSEGRVVNINNTNTPSITYTDANGATQTISTSSTTDNSGPDVTWTQQTCSSSLGNVDSPGPYTTNYGTSEKHYTLQFPNGSSYALTYDSDGELIKIVYPTGGYTKYDYQAVTGDYSSQNYDCTADVRQVVAKHACTSSSGACSSEDTTTYTPDMGGGAYTANQYMDVRDPYGNRTRYEFSTARDYSAGTKEINRYIYSGESTLLRTIHTDYIVDSYNYTIRPCSLPIRVTTTLNDVSPTLQYKTETDYGTIQSANSYYGSMLCDNTAQYIDNPIAKREYDYDGSLKRTTTLSWNAQTPNAPHILDRLSSSSVLDPNTGVTSTTSNIYDGAGNLISESRSGTGAPTLTTQYQRNAHGDITQITDPKNNITILSYDNPWSDSFCPATASGKPSSVTDALGHVTSFKYSSCIGNPTSTTDPNNQQTTFTYDAIGRRTSTSYPDGGHDQITYTDSLPQTIQTSRKMDTAGHLIVSKQIMDGLGRELQAQRTSDPEGTSYVDTVYDSLGRTHSVSNPYYSTSDPTYGITTYTYDALDRKLSQTNQDNTTKSWSYGGNCFTFTDEAQHSWTDCDDALGRLTSVVEPGNLQTAYSYNALDNLVSVSQLGNGSTESPRQRSFTYDALSRLVQSYNPELGWTCYGTTSGGAPNGSNCTSSYDGDGNLTAKTDARGVTTSYTYDALNRLTDKTFSDGATPGQHFRYDQTSGWMGTQYNTIGRLSEAGTDQDHRYYGSGNAPACNPQGSATANYNPAYGNPTYCNWTDELFSYDAMGRQARIGSAPPSEAGWAAHEIDMTYDLAGNMTSLRYPDGRVVTQQFDTGDRLQNISYDNWNGTHVGYNYLTMDASKPYFPNGSPAKFTLGNGAIETFGRNTRLQLSEIKLQANAGGLANQTLFDKQYNYTSSCQSNNNGNVMQVIQVAPMNSGDSQGFCYDPLNRVTSFSNGSGSMQQSYTYDSFGNLTQSGTLSFAPSFDANNRINYSGYTYDAAGNLTSTNNGVTTSTYAFDADSRPFSNSAGGYYTYDAANERMRKDVGGSYTEYQYLNGQPIAEKHSDGTWSDYVYANGQRIARADSYDVRIHFTGTNCSNCGPQGWAYKIPLGAYTIQPGDKIAWRQYQTGPAVPRGGLGIAFTDGVYTNWVTYDQDGQVMNSDTTQNSWHYRVADLSQYAGKTINFAFIVADTQSGAGYWEEYFSAIAFFRQDGTVQPIYNRQTNVSYSGWGYSGGTNETFEVNINPGEAVYPITTVAYYIGDQVGSTQMELSGGGWPVSSDTFYPFGQDTAAAGPNHYQFTGKERDAESGFDYFGARYYASAMGRFTSPDWSAKEEPVPYAKLDNPQTLNLYAYVGNNPLSRIDADGHDPNNPSDQVVCQGSSNCHTVDDPLRDPKKAQQQNSSTGGTGFWHRLGQHLSNLIHGHSWNFSDATVTISETFKIVGAKNDSVSGAADVAGAAGALIGGKTGKVLGPLATAISVVNDPSPTNLTINGLGLVDGLDVPIAIGTVAWDGSQLVGNQVIIPVFTPDALQSDTINDGNGHTIPSPARDDWGDPPSSNPDFYLNRQ